ncbi:hypothetical protein QQX98_004750 [Neonectria punicea]|uniref:Uncharacterized protein n=1 Tax=Neonectria punicea TaxID=979145 RepID=A0ABR1H7Q6_9HYPO
MADVLAHARQNEEFPDTIASPLDTRALVEDYENLMMLRHARGDVLGPASEEYTQLRVEICQGVAKRDASLSPRGDQSETSRRVESYFRSVEQEGRHLDMVSTKVNAMVQKCGVAKPTQPNLENVGEELCSVIEHTIEETVSDATGPLRLNVGTLKEHNNTLRLSVCNLDKQAVCFQTQNEALRSTVGELNESLNRQVDLHSHVLEQQTLTADQLAQVSGSVNRLSQIVMNLPTALNQVVYTSVQHQIQDAFKDTLEAQQKAICDLEPQPLKAQALARESEENKRRACGQVWDLCVHTPLGPRRCGRKGKGKMREIMHKVFRS